MAELEAEAKAEADAKRAEIAGKEEERREKEERTGRGTPGRKPEAPSNKPEDRKQRNFTDPDSRIMKDGATKSFEQCYNCEAAVDAGSQVIAAADVRQEANDKKQIKPMTEQVKANAGEAPEKLSAEGDFYSEANVKYLEGEGVDAYVATEEMKHPVGSTTLSGRRGGERPPPPRGPIPKDATTKQRMQRKLRTKKGRETYSKRKSSVEPVFPKGRALRGGQIKDARGFRRLLRGLEAVRAEWRLTALTHKLLKLFRSVGLARAG